VLGDVVEWLADEGASMDRVRQEILAAFAPDAYSLARNLERRGWAPDARLVSILDDISTWHVHKQLSKDWVTTHGITVVFGIGDRICTSGIKAGTVVAIYPDHAQIVVQPDDRRAEFESRPHSGTVINVEDAVRIAGTIGAEVPA
jgi:hypothetical protein